MLNVFDSFLNKTTMYRLILYYLLGMIGAAIVFSFFGILSFNPFNLLFSVLFFTSICLLSNDACAWAFDAPTNLESPYITALLLTLIIRPPASPWDLSYFTFAFWAAVWAMGSKYLFAIKKKHLFNPGAFAVAVMALTTGQSANWWVGTAPMLPIVLAGGILIIRKLRRADLAWSFLISALMSIIVFGMFQGLTFTQIASKTILSAPLFFFLFVMLTEPLTTPPTRMLRIWYGALVGFLFAPWVHVGSLFSTPELALLAGNVFSYMVSPKQKLLLQLKEKVQVADGTFDFVFKPINPISYRPGQYMEWTLPHGRADDRGNRRYFTVASSPTETEMRIGVKFYPRPSTFKQRMLDMKDGDRIVASQISGDFVMPQDSTQKLVFIGGGIGVTPFRSMLKYLTDRKEKRDIVFFYFTKFERDFAYREVFDAAAKIVGIKMLYILTEPKEVPKGWKGLQGFMTPQLIEDQVHDYRERKFYISGPHAMVVANTAVLRDMGIPITNIKEDFFPGFA